MPLPTKTQFLQQTANYTKESLEINGLQVMQTWETPYMEKLASIACQRGGKVLEVGFGMGISASFIQKNSIMKHVVIEAHPEVCNHARNMFDKQIKQGRLEILQGYWKDVTKNLKNESFNGILFDTYPLEGEDDGNFSHFIKEAYRLLKRGGIFTYYSDRMKTLSKNEVARFKSIGFTKTEYHICKVDPPKDCDYWKKKTIVAPIVVK